LHNQIITPFQHFANSCWPDHNTSLTASEAQFLLVLIKAERLLKAVPSPHSCYMDRPQSTGEARALSNRLGGQFVLFEHSGHMTMIEQTDLLAETISTWVTTL
jgi:pimeloyl-ACP methyl ester carboxylesterase